VGGSTTIDQLTGVCSTPAVLLLGTLAVRFQQLQARDNMFEA
jgi:hypothetical protein